MSKWEAGLRPNQPHGIAILDIGATNVKVSILVARPIVASAHRVLPVEALIQVLRARWLSKNRRTADSDDGFTNVLVIDVNHLLAE